MRCSTVRAGCVSIPFSPEIAESRVRPRTWEGFISCDFSSPASSWRELQLPESFTYQDSASEVHTLRSWYLGFQLWIGLWRHSAVKTPQCRTKPAAERLHSPSQAMARAAMMEQATVHTELPLRWWELGWNETKKQPCFGSSWCLKKLETSDRILSKLDHQWLP